MDRFLVHSALNGLSSLGLFALAGVLYLVSGISIYTIGFLLVALLTLYRAAEPFVSSETTKREISDTRLGLDIVSVLLVWGTFVWFLSG